jgi:hypothetical protein
VSPPRSKISVLRKVVAATSMLAAFSGFVLIVSTIIDTRIWVPRLMVTASILALCVIPLVIMEKRFTSSEEDRSPTTPEDLRKD